MIARARKSGFALVITLIMLVLAAVMVVALLTSATLDRTTAQSVADRVEAELAAQNALEAAKKALTGTPAAGTAAVTADDSFLVVRVDAPGVPVTASPTPAKGETSYYYLAKAQAGGAGAIDYYPLFSGPTPPPGTINLAAQPAVSRPAPPPNPAAQDTTAAISTDSSKTKILRAYPLVGSWVGAPSTQWVELRDPTDTAAAGSHTLPYQRYTFWVEDLAGYVDAELAGNLDGSGGANRRPNTTFTPTDWTSYAKRYQTNASELALFTLFNPTPSADPTDTQAKDVIDKRFSILSPATLKLIAPGTGGADITSEFLASRLMPDNELPLVPFGYGYTDEGNAAKARIDLNAQVATGGDAAVQAIAAKISQNLPNFAAARKGGLTGLDYAKTLAASIVDYADTNSDGTTGSDYRGFDSYPLVNEIYGVKNYTRRYVNGTWFVEVTLDSWAELWNMTNQPISGSLVVNVAEDHPVQVGANTYSLGPQPPGGNSTVVTTYPAGQTISAQMQPNEFKVFHLRSDVFQLDSGVSPPLSLSGSTLPLTQSVKGKYEVTWNGVVIDRANSGIERLAGSLPGPSSAASNRRWRGSLPGFVGIKSGGGFIDTMGDPRLSYYWGCAQAANLYKDNASMWARNIRSGITLAGPSDYKEVKPTSWPDGGHNSATVAAGPGSEATDPPGSPPVPAQSSKAPATISNSGSYQTAAELDNIYDPGQWNIQPDANRRWQDITSSSTADANYGGGMTLRIGRPEFTRFDQPGTRAWQLLDLFHAGSRVNTRGLINVNTASEHVLRALGSNILLDRDPEKLPAGSLYPPFTANQGDQFAKAVMDARPFLSAAQLSNIKIPGTNTSFFGNPAAWTWNDPAQKSPTEWNDSATEEYFAKVYPLSTVRSRNFRVYVTGQSLDKNNNVLSTVNKVFQVFLSPTRDATGKITAQTVVTTYEAQVPL